MSLKAYLYELNESMREQEYEEILLRRYILFYKALFYFVCSDQNQVLDRIVVAVSKLPFGCSPSLPWCRESFPELDLAMKEWEGMREKREGKE